MGTVRGGGNARLIAAGILLVAGALGYDKLVVENGLDPNRIAGEATGWLDRITLPTVTFSPIPIPLPVTPTDGSSPTPTEKHGKSGGKGRSGSPTPTGQPSGDATPSFPTDEPTGPPDRSSTGPTNGPGLGIPPTTITCSPTGFGWVQLTWTPVAGATSYTLRYGEDGGRAVDLTNTAFAVTTPVSDATAWVVVNTNSGSSLPSNRVTYTVAAVSSCS